MHSLYLKRILRFLLCYNSHSIEMCVCSFAPSSAHLRNMSRDSFMNFRTSSERRRKQGKLMVEIHEGYKMELRTAVSRGLIDSDSARQLVDSMDKKS